MEVSQKPNLDASWIDPDALEIVNRLQRSGHKTYLVGGCVRDLLLGVHPKDFDLVTSARPEEIRRRVPGSFLIGKRFRLVLVKRGLRQFEVATFRRPALPEEQAESTDQQNHSLNNIFGTPEQDALRRDFSINALFYDPVEDRVIDFIDGLKDLKERCIRMIGKPDVRIHEDAVRSLRAVRFAHKTGLKLDPELRQATSESGELVARIPLARRRLEYLKLFALEDPTLAFVELMDLGILQACMPTLAQHMQGLEDIQDFLQPIRNWSAPKNTTNTLLLPWVWSWLQSEKSENENFSTKVVDDINEWMQKELGLFRSETADIWSTLELLPRLENISAFLKKGSRRQKSFLSNPLLIDAFHLAQWDCRLNPMCNSYWETRLLASAPEKSFVKQSNQREEKRQLLQKASPS